MRLVQQPALVTRGFRRQCDQHRIARRLKPRAHIAYKGRVGRRVLGRDKLEINVHACKALRSKGLREVFDQCAAGGRVLEQPVCALARKLTVFPECGQHEQRAHAVLPRHAREQVGVLRQDAAHAVKPIGKHGQIGQIGQRAAQHAHINIRVGIAVDRKTAQLFPIG